MVSCLGVPAGYMPGHDRNDTDGELVTHLYKGDMSDPGKPMCARGWNRLNGHGYSILRNNVGSRGICKICLRRAQAGLDGVEDRDRKTRWL